MVAELVGLLLSDAVFIVSELSEFSNDDVLFIADKLRRSEFVVASSSVELLPCDSEAALSTAPLPEAMPWPCSRARTRFVGGRMRVSSCGGHP